MGGIMSLTGERGGAPVKPGLPVADLTSGLWVAIAILAALRGARRPARACHVDFSMLDGQIALLTLAAARYFALGEVPPRLGTEHPGRVPSASFRCADGDYLHITASDQHWLPLCQALGLEAWGSETELQGNSGRVRRRDEVMAQARRGHRARNRDDRLGAALDAVGVPHGPIRDVDEILTDAHTAARGLVETFTHPTVGEFQALRMPFKFDRLGRSRRSQRPPLLGRAYRPGAGGTARALARAHREAQRGKGDMNLTTVLYGVDDGVATITLNRPESRNALNRAMCEDLIAAAAAVAADPDVRLVLVRGNGPVFCAGADLKERKGMSRRRGAHPPHARVRRLRRARKPADAGRRRGARGGDRLGQRDRRRVRFHRRDAGGDASPRPRRSGARSARRSGCRACSASGSPRT